MNSIKGIPTRVTAVAVFSMLLRASVADCGVNTWTSNLLTHSPVVRSIAIDPENSLIVYSAHSADGVFKSPDGGKSWVAASTGLGRHPIALAIDPTSPGTLYAGTSDGVFKSINGGAAWTNASVGIRERGINALAIDPLNPTTLYAGTRSSGPTGTFYKTVDGGASWRDSGQGLPVDEGISALAIDPVNPTIVYAGTWIRGVFKSMDAGATWRSVNGGRPLSSNTTSLAIDASRPSTLYAGHGFGVFKSTNSGEDWVDLNAGLDSRYAVLSLAIDPRVPSTIYAGTGGAGVYRSTDGGVTWSPFNRGLRPLTTVTSLAIDSTGTRIHAGTEFGGVYDYEIVALCSPAPDRLCLLDNRFQLTLQATDPRTGRVGIGQAIAQGDRHGSFSLPSFTGDPTFPEVIVKMLDATSVPPPLGGFFWVFHTGLTDLQYTLTVTDLISGAVRTYQNNRNDPVSLCGGADTAAFRD